MADHGNVRFADLRNLLSGSALGASQVTAVVENLAGRDGGGTEYAVALRASLVAPYFLRLRDPVPVAPAARQPIGLSLSVSRGIRAPLTLLRPAAHSVA